MNHPRGRPFQPGNTLGRGRPKGSRNRSKSPAQELLDEYAPHLTRKCIAQALEGDRSAMRLCMERASPVRRGACITLSLPAIKTAGDVDKAAEKVTQAILRGKIAPTEGSVLMNILESRSRIIERGQWESRLEKLEEKVATADLPRAARGRDIMTERIDRRKRHDHSPGRGIDPGTITRGHGRW
jgi:hypothetical protein